MSDLVALLNSICLPRRRQVAAEGEIFQQGDPAGEIFQVEEGAVRLIRYTADGKALTLYRALPGQTFAEAALFSPSYHCTARADRPSRIAGYAKQELLAGLEARPEIMFKLIALMSRQVRDLRTLLEIRSLPVARERILHYLLLKADPASGAYIVPTTLKEFAVELGLAHETLYRTLAALEEEGLISRKGRHLTLGSLTAEGTP